MTSGAATAVCRTGLAFAAALRHRRRTASPRGLVMIPGRRLRVSAVRQPHSQGNFDGENRNLGDVSSRTYSKSEKRILYQSGRQFHPLRCARSLLIWSRRTSCIAAMRNERERAPLNTDTVITAFALAQLPRSAFAAGDSGRRITFPAVRARRRERRARQPPDVPLRPLHDAPLPAPVPGPLRRRRAIFRGFPDLHLWPLLL